MRYLLSKTSTNKRTLTLALVCSIIAIICPETFARPSFTVKPPQSWVRTVNFSSSAKPESNSTSSTTFILDDHQTRVSEKSVERYYHHVQRVENAVGLDDLSQVKLYFEPSYQQLTLHFIRIQRGSEVINALRPSEIKIIQQEEELNQQLYNGTLAALVFLNDLRVGDVVDYSYTISGENPVLNGRFADTYYLGDSEAIQQLTCRLVWPSARALAIKNSNIEIAPEVHQLGSDTEYVWERHNVASVNVEDAIPDWYDPYPKVSLSEFQTWPEVVNWALPLYGAASLDDPALVSRVKKWEADFSSAELRTLAALRFVQDEIRYLGIELGRYSHQPTLPAKVFARRFGDCKDKSMLLAAILKSMGIDAVPALVNSSEGRALDNRQPSPFAFDHVIVQAKIGGKTYWFDPTISYQRGGLDKYYDPPYERALVLRAETSGLENIPLPAAGSGSVDISEKYEGPAGPGPISLLVRSEFAGSEADYMRSYLAGTSIDDLKKNYLNFYAASNPSIRAVEPPQVKDDETSNTIVVTEKYAIDDFWRETKHHFVADKIYDEVGKPNFAQRSMPLRTHYPLLINQHIEINLSEAYNITPTQATITDDIVRFDYAYVVNGNNIRLEFSLKTLADSVPIEKVPRHLLVLDKIRDVVGFELSRDAGQVIAIGDGSAALPGRSGAWALLLLLPVALVVGILVYRYRQELKPAAFARATKSKIGSSPDAAIHVTSPAEINPVLSNFKCDCEHQPFKPETPPVPERFTYDGRSLVGIRLACDHCLKKNDLYFEVEAVNASSVTRDSQSY